MNHSLSQIRRQAGLIGGPARAKVLTPERRSEIARMGAIASNKAKMAKKKMGNRYLRWMEKA